MTKGAEEVLDIEDEETELDTGTDDEGELADADRGDDLPDEPTDEDLKAVADEGAEEAEDDEQKGSKVVPHARFNEINEENKANRARLLALEEENARLKGAAGAGKDDKGDGKDDPPAVDLKALRKKRNEALMEGDSDKASDLDEQIDTEVERRASEKAAAAAESSILSRQVRQEFAGAVSESIKKYPFLDAKGEEPNSEAITEVVEWRDFYISKGKSPAEALRQAVNKVGPQHAPKTGDDGGEADDQGKSVAAKRRELALKRNADAANAQPARPGGTGERSSASKLKVEDMTDEEYDRLPAKTRAELRGDNV